MGTEEQRTEAAVDGAGSGDGHDTTQSLLQRMLGFLSGGGLHTIEEAAHRLGVSEGLVSAMVDNLARRGYLVALESGCSTACSGCAAAGSCAIPGNPASVSRLLALTSKGRLAARPA